MGNISIFLFGNFRLVYSRAYTLTPPITRNLKGLLSYLLLHRHRVHSREVLASIFWGETGQEKARHCLNTALWRLRQVLEPADTPKGTFLLSSSSGEIGFNVRSDYWLDVAVFEAKVSQILAKPVEKLAYPDAQELEDTMKLYTGELLEGFYEDWALQNRERLHALYLECLAHLMHYYRYKKIYDKSLAFGKQILVLEPLREEIHRKLMRIYQESGNRAMALRQYQVCCQILARELDIGPMEETRELHQRILKTDNLSPWQITREIASYNRGVGPTNLAATLSSLRLALKNCDDLREKLQQTIRSLEVIIP